MTPADAPGGRRGAARRAGALSAGRSAHDMVKRLLDLLLAGCGLIVLAPVLLAIALAIRLDSPGPVFFRQVPGSAATGASSASTSSAR